MSQLALLGGTPARPQGIPADLLKWPIFTEEDEAAALDVIRRNAFSGTNITMQFEKEFAEWIGAEYAVAYCNGTASLSAAMFAIGLQAGDEIICPTKTYWASISQAINFGATAVFCNVNEMLSMDPDDIERCITPRTKALMVVHYVSYPCDMDRIMAIAKKYNLKVIEDVSHAQGGKYKGKRLGTFGDVGAMSLMSEKAFSAGELGIMVTNDRRLYERGLAFGHYERNNSNYILEADEIKPFPNVALGGIKGRVNQLCSAIARVQLKYYDERTAKIREAMNYFWDQLEGLPGIRAIRVDESTGSTMGGWYSPVVAYFPEELHNLSVNVFVKALNAEGFAGNPGGNNCLHTSQFFKSFDLLGLGKPSRIAYNDSFDIDAMDKACNPSINRYCFSMPRFIYLNKEWIDYHVAAMKKVIEHHEDLLELPGALETTQNGIWYRASST